MSESIDSPLGSIDRMLNPKSVAVIGASPRMAYGGRFLASALVAKDHLRVYPINPNHETIMDTPCYPSISALPEVPDVVGVLVPYDAVLGVLEECHAFGVRAAVVISAGFSERDQDNRRELQARLGEFARTSGLRICGPNCLGVVNVASGIWLCSTSSVPYGARGGGVGVVSQSGATAFATLLVRAVDLGIGMSALISTGNEADLDVTDFIRYLLDDPATKVIASYVEGFKDARKFLAVAELAAERGVPIVLTKTGRSTQGAIAARAHTASLGSDAIYDGVFDQFGVIRTDDFEDMLEVANLLARTPRPRRSGIGLLSHSGGINAMTSDLLGLNGLELPPLTEKTRRAIEDVLQGFGWAANPADLTGHMYTDSFGTVVGHMAAEPEIGTIVVASAGPETHVAALLRERDASDTGFVYLWTGTQREHPGLELLREAEVPVFSTPASLAVALAKHARYFAWRDGAVGERPKVAHDLAPAPNAVLSALGALGRSALSGDESERLLSAFGLPVPTSELVADEEAAIAAARALGYPVVLKADSPALPHKSELGVIELDLESDEDVANAYRTVFERAAAQGVTLNGIVVQEQIRDGIETIVSIAYDAQVGPVICFGLGGIFVELYNDVVFRACPLRKDEATAMINSVRGAALLRGFRGAPPRDLDALAETLVTLSEAAILCEGSLVELEINPLLVLPQGKGVKAVDVLATLK